MTEIQPAGDHWAYFGDGNAAMIVDSKEVFDKEVGDKFTQFLFIPTDLIKKMYDLSDITDAAKGVCMREYRTNQVIWLQRGVHRSRCWITTDFMGGPTPASRRHEDLTMALEDTARLLRSAEAAKNRAYQELDKERQQLREAIKSQTDLILTVAKARGKTAEEGFSEEDLAGAGGQP